MVLAAGELPLSKQAAGMNIKLDVWFARGTSVGKSSDFSELWFTKSKPVKMKTPEMQMARRSPSHGYCQ